jgi:hypothetical protein
MTPSGQGEGTPVSTGAAPYKRRYRIRIFFIPVGLFVILGIYLWHHFTGAIGVTCDFRDSGCLARAISAAAQKAGDGTVESSSCVQLAFPDYTCSVLFYSGNIATYQVEVATDGSWWHTT